VVGGHRHRGVDLGFREQSGVLDDVDFFIACQFFGLLAQGVEGDGDAQVVQGLQFAEGFESLFADEAAPDLGLSEDVVQALRAQGVVEGDQLEAVLDRGYVALGPLPPVLAKYSYHVKLEAQVLLGVEQTQLPH
jgi:hypothetical protein